MIPEIEYIKETELDLALQHLASDKKVIPFAGGTDVLIELRKSKNPFDRKALLDVKGLGLNDIYIHSDTVIIGAASTHTEVEDNEIIKSKLPVLTKASSLIGSKQIRNRGTIGGNIINASPCADTVPALLLYDAQIVIRSLSEDRTVPLSEFITSPYETVLQKDELVTEIRAFPVAEDYGWGYYKLGRRGAVNISRMTVAALMKVDGEGKINEIRVSAGSVFPITSRISDVEKMLVGEKPKAEIFRRAGEIAAEKMIETSGRRWSTPYKESVVKELIVRVLNEAYSRCKNDDLS